MVAATLFGRHLKHFRHVQGLSQLSLATLACTTTRHISFLENGRSRPSADMVQRLAAALEVPVRERNQLLVSAGFAASYPEQDLDEDQLKPYMTAIRHMMKVHAPYPAILKNRHHDIIEMNEPAKRLMMLIDPTGGPQSMIEWLLRPSPQVLSKFENYEEVAWSTIYRIRGEAAAKPNDTRLAELAQLAERRAKELKPLGILGSTSQDSKLPQDFVKCPTMLVHGKRLRVMGILARFGTALDANLDDLCVELLHPRDDETRRFFEELAERTPLRLAH